MNNKHLIIEEREKFKEFIETGENVGNMYVVNNMWVCEFQGISSPGPAIKFGEKISEIVSSTQFSLLELWRYLMVKSLYLLQSI